MAFRVPIFDDHEDFGTVLTLRPQNDRQDDWLSPQAMQDLYGREITIHYSPILTGEVYWAQPTDLPGPRIFTPMEPKRKPWWKLW
jgi:hypothetical protein